MGNHVATLQDRLDGDLVLLRRAFNQGVLYFRQLQETSDSVTDAEWEEATVAMALQASLTETTTLETKMNTTQARRRYLDNLVNNHDELDRDEDGLYIVQMSIHSWLYHTMVWHSISPSKLV